MTRHIVSACLILLLLPALAFAAPPTPEIDMSAAPAALAALGGVLMIVRARRKS